MRRALSVVLHTHMPYVEGYGTWPFGEEWLWEAIATSYLPLLDVLDAHPGRVTMSLTPVLADQLAADGVSERFAAFMRDVREASHALDLEAHPEVAPQLERSLERYRAALAAFERRGGDLLAAFAPHAAWTSAATHPVLPLLATDAGVRLQVRTGVESHRARFGAAATAAPPGPTWGGGFWLPECAYAPWLDRVLEESGVATTCVELTDYGIGCEAPLRSPAGVTLVPIDRPAIDRVWSMDGYPSHGDYLNTRAHTERRHLAWSVDGAPHDFERAATRARAHAADFVARLPDEGLCVCALDTELLGHWWAEGVAWLEALIGECEAGGVDLLPLDDAVAGFDAVDAPAELPVCSWGRPRTLATWSAPRAGGLAWRQRAAELRVLAAGPAAGKRALRELLALQSSDWSFLVSEDTAGPYPLDRAAGHEAALADALSAGDDAPVRGLAPWVSPAPLREP